MYISQGLYKYYQLSGDPKVKEALLTHGRWQLSNPSLNHKMESFMASIPSLIAYEFSGVPKFLTEAEKRAKFLYTDQLPVPAAGFKTHAEFADALEKVSHMPADTENARGEAIWKISNGLRIFGWTHIYNIPYLVYWLIKKRKKHRNNTPKPAVFRES